MDEKAEKKTIDKNAGQHGRMLLIVIVGAFFVLLVWCICCWDSITKDESLLIKSQAGI